MEGEQQIGRREAERERGEDSKGRTRALRQRETDGGPHKRRGARSSHHNSEHAGEKAASVAAARRQAGAGVGYSQANLKHSGERQAEEKKQQSHDRNKAGRLELEAPAQLPASCPEAQ